MRNLSLCALRFSLAAGLLLVGSALSVAAEPANDSIAEPAETVVPPERLQPLGDQTARSWTDAAGERQVSAVLVAASAESVELRKTSGQSFVVPLSALSDNDQKIVREQLTRASQTVRHEVRKVEIPNIAPESNSSSSASKAPAPLPANMVYVRITRDLLAKQLSRDVRYRTDIVDNILGTSIRGTGDVEGKTDLVLFDDANRVRGELRLSGHMNSRTTGYNGPVQIGSRAVTQFKSAKAIVLDEQGLRVGPAVTKATTHSTTTGISSNLGGIGDRIARNRASGEVAAKRPTADRIAAEHASQRINRRFDSQVAERMDELKSLPTETLPVANDHPLKPRSFRCKTVGEFIYVAVLGDSSDDSTLAAPPTWNSNPAGLELYVHSSAVRQAMADQELRQTFEPLLESVAGAMTSEIHTVGTGSGATSQDWTSNWSDDRQWLCLTWHGEKLPTIAKLPKSTSSKIR